MTSKEKAIIAETAVAADLTKRGYHVALPLGDCDAYDLLFRRVGPWPNHWDVKKPPATCDAFHMERVQVKYTKSDGKVIQIKARSHSTANSEPITRLYGPAVAEWVAVYDVTTNQCYYIPTQELVGLSTGVIYLRLTLARNGQDKGVRWARDYLAI
jgi:hypothetical protein